MAGAVPPVLRRGIAGRDCVSGISLSWWWSILLFKLERRPRFPGVAVALEVDGTAPYGGFGEHDPELDVLLAVSELCGGLPYR